MPSQQIQPSLQNDPPTAATQPPATAARPHFYNRILVIAILIAGCIPLVRLLAVLFSDGANCIGNDHAAWIRVIDSVLSGTYDWRNFPQDSFLGSHCAALPILIELGLARAGLWSIRTESLIGITIMAASVYFQWDVLRTGIKSGRIRALLAAALLAINFAATQSSSLLSGFYSLHHAALCRFGLSLGIWSLIKLRGSALAATAWAGMGGIIACYSFGVAVPVWATLWATFLATGYRKLRDWAVLGTACALAFAPYLCFVTARGANDNCSHFDPCATEFDFFRYLNLIGRPFSNSIALEAGRLPGAELAALFGISAVILMLWVKRKSLAQIFPALAFTAYGLLSAALICAYRFNIAPWYVVQPTCFWIGLVALAAACIGGNFGVSDAIGSRYSRWLGAMVFAITAVLFIMSNRTYDDKQFYLYSRSPASESYTRHYLTAPTYGEQLLFQWDPGNQQVSRFLCSRLQKHGLLCFGREQEWTLQGDYFLHTANFATSKSRAPTWILGTCAERERPWNHYHHLNLLVQAPQAVTWQVALPDSASNIMFQTALATATHKGNALIQSIPASARITLSARSQNGSIDRVTYLRKADPNRGFTPISFDLSSFAGKEVTVSLSSITGGAVFEYPRICFAQEPEKLSEQQIGETKPENTDLSPFFPKNTQNSVTLDKVPGSELRFSCPPIMLSQCSHVYFKAQTSEPKKSPVVFLKFNFTNYPSLTVPIPLVEVEAEHAYTYDTKLLQTPPNTTLQGIDVSIYDRYKLSPPVHLHDFRLLRFDK